MKPWTVVVGVDGSEEAHSAAQLGRRIARRSDGVLHLVTAAEDPSGYATLSGTAMDVTALDDAIREDAWRHAAEGLSGLFSTETLEDLLKVGLGQAEAVVAERGREVDADLFVLGGHRRGTVESWFHRSTTRHLIRVGDRPVLVTGPAGHDVSRVLAALDFGPLASRTMHLAVDLARLLNVPLEAVHVVQERDFPDSREVMLALQSLVEAEERTAHEELGELVPEGSGWNVLRGRPATILDDLAAADPATLLVMGAHGRGWMERLLVGSTTSHILRALPSSILVVPAETGVVPGRTPSIRSRALVAGA